VTTGPGPQHGSSLNPCRSGFDAGSASLGWRRAVIAQWQDTRRRHKYCQGATDAASLLLGVSRSERVLTHYAMIARRLAPDCTSSRAGISYRRYAPAVEACACWCTMRVEDRRARTRSARPAAFWAVEASRFIDPTRTDSRRTRSCWIIRSKSDARVAGLFWMAASTGRDDEVEFLE